MSEKARKIIRLFIQNKLKLLYKRAINFLKYYERPASLNYSRGTQAEYWYTFLGGIPPTPPTPAQGVINKKFKWVLYANKIRKRHLK